MAGKSRDPSSFMGVTMATILPLIILRART
jgi:hypothetical protein